MWGCYMPALIITDNPDVGDNDETNDWDFTGEAMATSGNDELYVAAA
jgi:hypothetical protein